MSETESTHEAKAAEKAEKYKHLHDDNLAKFAIYLLQGSYNLESLSEAINEIKDEFEIKYKNKKLSDTPESWSEFIHELMDEFKNKYKNNPTTIEFSIVEEPLSPQNLALILTALTELTTKLWLIEKRRFADLIEYTQTHDIRFANEAGTTITWATYNSPFSFGFQVDKLVPSVAEAVMTVVDGLSQRKAHLERLEIENLAAAQKIKEAKEKLKQQQDMAAFEREKQEIELEKLRLVNEIERQTVIERRLESQRKQIEDALELAGKAVDIVYPNADADMRLMLIQTLLNNILQLHSAAGLELILPKNKEDDSSKEDVEQT